MTDGPLSAMVSLDATSDEYSLSYPASYVVRIHEGWGEHHHDDESLIAEYDTNTINLRAVVEYLGMVIRKHDIDPEDVHFHLDCDDLRKMWWQYAEIR
jgi:hypothetical protein